VCGVGDSVVVVRKRVFAGISVEANDVGGSGAVGADKDGCIPATLREASRAIKRAGEVVGNDANSHGNPVVSLVCQFWRFARDF
jgi:hypothetical protein